MGKENMGFYDYFFLICLFAGYEHHGFYFSMARCVMIPSLDAFLVVWLFLH
jgi:hypothetical protein